MSDLPVVVIGAGGHARVLVEALLRAGTRIVGAIDPDGAAGRSLVITYLGGDDVLAEYPPSKVRLVNAVGSTGDASRRRGVFERFKNAGYTFASVIHPAAVVATSCQLAEGVQVMAGAVVQPGTRIGANSLINTSASVDHDCVLGAHVHIAPGATLSGGVRVGDNAHIGTAACVIQQVVVGEGAVIGAGAVVLADVDRDTKVAGVPARGIAR